MPKVGEVDVTTIVGGWSEGEDILNALMRMLVQTVILRSWVPWLRLMMTTVVVIIVVVLLRGHGL